MLQKIGLKQPGSVNSLETGMEFKMSRLDDSQNNIEEKETIKIATIAALAKAIKENTKHGHFRTNGEQTSFDRTVSL